MKTFFVPDDFRAFMQSVVTLLDAPTVRFLDKEDALRADCGYGGRVDGLETYAFRYITADERYRWDLVIQEQQIRDIADGFLIEIDGRRVDLVRGRGRTAVGYPLLVWGPSDRDALDVHHEAELAQAFDLLHERSREHPVFLRLWTAIDDQLVAALAGERNALYVVESADGYATSMGDASLRESFTVSDPEGHVLEVPLADCVSWDYARRALRAFVDRGDLGEIPTDGRIPSLLLMMGEVDRVAAIAARGEVPRVLLDTNLGDDGPGDETSPRATPVAGTDLTGWARRVLEHLHADALIELTPKANADALVHALADLLDAYARDAESSLETAVWFASELGGVAGIARLAATGADLQAIIRATRPS